MNDAEAGRILDIILTMRNETSPGAAAEGGAYNRRKIARAMRLGGPIKLLLPAFPAKSSNPEKTLGSLPDYGEVLALKRLDGLCRRIGEAYAPGARLMICSDGRVFSDLVSVSDEAVSRYGQGIARIIADYGLERLSTFDLEDAFPDCAGYEELRARLVSECAEPVSAVRERTLRDPASLQLFNGIHRFLFEDMLVLQPGLSRNKARLAAKELAYAVISRSNAWSGLVERRFPDAVRLSIHPQPAESRKIGVRLLPSASAWRTPWHSALLFDGKDHSLVRRREAEEMRAVLVQADGRYPYYMTESAHALN